MIIDMTTPYDALKNLGEYLNINSEDILMYIATHKDLTVDDFIEYFNIDINELLGKELYLSCLHVTTNNDECKSIKEYGLTNLQDSIKLDTPLSRYLKENGLNIDIKNRTVNYKGIVYDISSEKSEFDIDQDNLDKVYYKFFKDYQINAFFSCDNVLNYGGEVKRRPEILYNLSRLLNNGNIEYDWEKQNNKCYVVHFACRNFQHIYRKFLVP